MSNERGEGAQADDAESGADGTRMVRVGTVPLILSIDTATATRSIALVRGQETLAIVYGDLRASHSANVLGDIDAVVRKASVKLGAIDLFAAANGPGSFTGLRAGLATIKSFGATLGRPVVGVPTLHAIAYAVRPARKVIAMIPAGRGEVFAQLLSVNAQGEMTELERPAHVSPALLIESRRHSTEGLKWAGSGAQLYAALIGEAALEAAFNLVEEAAEGSSDEVRTERETQGDVWTLARPVEILATHVAALALQSFAAGQSVEAADLRAIYVRASDAELNEKWRAQQSGKEVQSNISSAR